MSLATLTSWIRQVYGLFEVARGLTDSPGTELDSSDGEALDKLFERAPTDMWGSSHPPHNARVVSWTDQKRKYFYYCPRHRRLLGGSIQAKSGSREALTSVTGFRTGVHEGAFLLYVRNRSCAHWL